MILNRQRPTPSGYQTLYFNLITETCYAAVYNEFSETSIDVPMTWDEELVKEIVLDEIETLERWLKGKTTPDEEIRYKKALTYLIHYKL